MDYSSSAFLSRAETARYLNVTEWWLEKHAHTGKGPRFIRHGRKVFYETADLEAWAEGPYAEEARAGCGKRKPADSELAEMHVRSFGPDAADARDAQRLWQRMGDAHKADVYRLLRRLTHAAE